VAHSADPGAFLFKQAVDRAFADYPHLRASAVFVSTACNAAVDTGGRVRMHGDARVKASIENTPRAAARLSALVSQARAEKNSYSQKILLASGACYTHVFNPADGVFRRALADEKHLAQAYSFYHELGHILCPDGFDQTEGSALRESCADAYATVRLLADYGDAARGFLARQAWYRAACFLYTGDGEYLTAPVIMQILSDIPGRRPLPASPDEMVACAQRYARKNAPTAGKKISAARDAYAKACADKTFAVTAIAQAFLCCQKELGQQIGAIVLAPFLQSFSAQVGKTECSLTSRLRAEVNRKLRKNKSGVSEDVFAGVTRMPSPCG
jgi:hypothetical protein